MQHIKKLRPQNEPSATTETKNSKLEASSHKTESKATETRPNLVDESARKRLTAGGCRYIDGN